MTEISSERLLELSRQANEYSARQFPIYNIQPIGAALVGFVASYMYLFVFFLVADLDPERFELAQWVCHGLTSGIPALAVWMRSIAHSRCFAEKFEKLRRDEIEKMKLRAGSPGSDAGGAG